MKPNSLHIVIGSYLYKYSGGCQTWMQYFLKGLTEKNFFKQIFIYHYKPQLCEDNIMSDYPDSTVVKFVSFKNTFKFEKGLYKMGFFSLYVIPRIMLKVSRGDCVLLIGPVYLSLIGLVLRVFLSKKIKIITWVRGIDTEAFRLKGFRFIAIAAKLEKLLLKKSDAIIANGFDTFTVYCDLYPDYSNKIHIIENAVDASNLNTLQIPDLEDEPIHIAYFGRLCVAKGFNYFLQAAQKYYETEGNGKVVFDVYGHGELEETIGKYVNYHGVYSPSDLLAIFSRVQVVIFLNDSKAAGGISHGILECLAAGRLIIAWDIPVHKQLLNCNNSILVEDRNVDEIVKEIINIIAVENKNCYIEKCINARITSSEYTITKHIDRFISLIESNSEL